MESHFGWLAVNHLSNVFRVQNLPIKGVEQVDGAWDEQTSNERIEQTSNERIEQASASQEGKADTSQTEQTVGSLDLGGASLEIAFLSNESTLVTRSFSSLGADQLRRRLLQQLKKEHRDSHPCYPAGFEESYEGHCVVGTGDVALFLRSEV